MIKVTCRTVIVAKKNEVKVECSAEIGTNIINGHGNKKMTLQNIDYVLNLCANFLSVLQMTRIGQRLVFKNENCNIFDKEWFFFR